MKRLVSPEPGDGWHFKPEKQRLWNLLLRDSQCEWCRRVIDDSFNHTFEVVFDTMAKVDRHMLCGLCVAHSLTGMDWQYNQAGSKWSIKQFFYNPCALDHRCLADGISPHFNDGEVYSGKPRRKRRLNTERLEELGLGSKNQKKHVLPVDERMCEECDRFLVAVYMKVGAADCARDDESSGKEYCYYCAAKVFIELETGKKKMALRQDASEPCLYEIRV